MSRSHGIVSVAEHKIRQEVSGSCPACGDDINYLYETEHIPYFSDILIITCSCQSCGYRFSDVQCLSTSEPVIYTLEVTSEEDLNSRVVRSTCGTITIPELGVEITPGPACEGFISNVEGVLSRVDHVLDGILIDGDPDQRMKAIRLKEQIVNIIAGKERMTLIIDDPAGNSLIASERAKKETYEPSSQS